MKYNKLVRDKIPEIIESTGKKAIIRTLADTEYTEYLEKKLDEEVAEFHESKSVEEIVDIVEVLCAIVDELGYECLDVTRRRAIKIAERGNFAGKTLLIEVLEKES